MDVLLYCFDCASVVFVFLAVRTESFLRVRLQEIIYYICVEKMLMSIKRPTPGTHKRVSWYLSGWFLRLLFALIVGFLLVLAFFATTAR